MTEVQAIEFVHGLLKLMLSRNASDLFLSYDFPPAIKVDGRMTPVGELPLSPRREELAPSGSVTVTGMDAARSISPS